MRLTETKTFIEVNDQVLLQVYYQLEENVDNQLWKSISHLSFEQVEKEIYRQVKDQFNINSQIIDSVLRDNK